MPLEEEVSGSSQPAGGPPGLHRRLQLRDGAAGRGQRWDGAAVPPSYASAASSSWPQRPWDVVSRYTQVGSPRETGLNVLATPAARPASSREWLRGSSPLPGWDEDRGVPSRRGSASRACAHMASLLGFSCRRTAWSTGRSQPAAPRHRRTRSLCWPCRQSPGRQRCPGMLPPAGHRPLPAPLASCPLCQQHPQLLPAAGKRPLVPRAEAASGLSWLLRTSRAWPWG